MYPYHRREKKEKSPGLTVKALLNFPTLNEVLWDNQRISEMMPALNSLMIRLKT